MSNTYTWDIPKNGLITMPTLNGQTDVVTMIRYEVTGTDGTHTATIRGTARVNYVAGAPFTPFTSLTQAEVIAWVQASQNNLVENTQAQIDSQIANMVNPPVRPVPKANPWGTCAPTTIPSA